MNRSPFMKTLKAAFFMLIVLAGCSNDNSENTSITEPGRDNEAQKGAAVNAVDPDDYNIHFSDSYGDTCYLNMVNHKDGRYLYWGVYVISNNEYNATVLYDSNTKMVSLMHQYRSYALLYNVEMSAMKSYGFYGTSESSYKRVYTMWINVSKGAFPGMGTAKPVNIDAQDFEIDTRDRLDVLMGDM